MRAGQGPPTGVHTAPHLRPPSVTCKADPHPATLANGMHSHDGQEQYDLARISTRQLLKAVDLVPATTCDSRPGDISNSITLRLGVAVC